MGAGHIPLPFLNPPDGRGSEMAVTIKDVAHRCGMSISTVSKVFNGYPDISEETRRQVMKVMS